MKTFLQDVRYAIRLLRKSPGFTLAAVFAVALGVGINTAMFSVVNAVLLNSRPLQALKEPDRLVMLWEKNPALNIFNGLRLPVCAQNYLDWKKQSRSFEDIAVASKLNLNLTGLRPEQIEAARASANFFSLLGIQPRLGRAFTAEEMQPGKGRVAILSDELYRRRYNGDPKILGKTIRAGGVDYEIVGVLPAGFQLPAVWEGFDQVTAALWVPLSLATDDDRRQRMYFAYGRLKPGVTLEQARAEMAVIAKGLETANPGLNRGFSVSVFPVAVEDVSPTLRRSLLILQVAVAFVLLIACANVANLLLTRAIGRQREIAIRAALGAGRLRILRQNLTESLVLSALGGAAGLLLAVWGLDALSALAPAGTHGFKELRLDPLVLGFTVAAGVLAGLFFGLAPWLHTASQDVNQALVRGGRTVGGTSNRLRSALVAGEIALSFVLLAGAGLMIRSLASLMAVDQGFRPENLLKTRIALPEAKYSTPEQLSIFGDRLLEAVRRLPGVRSATLARGVPMQELSLSTYRVEGAPERPNETPSAYISGVREDFFETMGIRLMRGRTFTRRDMDTKPEPIVVNEAFARQNWPGQDPIGKAILQEDGRNAVIGVVADTRQLGPDTPARPQIYFATRGMQSPMLLVRTAGDPMSLAGAIERQVWNIDKDQPVYATGTMESVLHDWTSARRFNMTVLIAFAALALALAAVGLYGVLAYTVSLRTREIGVRVALGADPRTIAKLIVKQGAALAAAGIALGAAGALALTRLMQTLIYGVSAADPYTFFLVAALLIAVTTAASFLPAWRAARVDPMEALRAE
ncbi:MAG: ABC transporter permease [Acidobacteriota bacterium]